MHSMPSPDDQLLRAARRHVLNGEPLPALLAEKLWARNIDVSAMERRLIHNNAFRS